MGLLFDQMQTGFPDESILPADKPQRLQMSAPTAKAGLSQGRLARNSNKHKRLFNPDEPNGVKVGRVWMSTLLT